MNETVLYILLILLILFAVGRIFLDVRRWINKIINQRLETQAQTWQKEQQKQLNDRFTLAFLQLEKDIEAKFFALTQNYNSEIKKNNLAKVEEIEETNQETQPPKKKLWEDVNQLKELRDNIGNGNQEQYRNVTELAELPPLDAWRTVDEALAKLEQTQFPTGV